MAASSVPVPFIDATGYHIPAFVDVLAGLQADYRGIYGSDVVLTSDTQDGQWIAIQAQGLHDAFSLGLAVYNSFSPATAQGTGLSSVVKVNGITREIASYSTCDVTVVGQAGTTLSGAQARDEAGYLWTLPALTIPLTGQVDVTATCATLGAVTAAAGTISQIATPTLGWQSVTNVGAATPGTPVETDPHLRIRQSQSTMIGATGVVDGIAGAIAALPGVERFRLYENDTNAPDANGVPGHSISAVVDGGDVTAIATAIAQRKLSAGTYGTTSAIVTTGAAKIPRTISFFRPLEPAIIVGVTLKALSGFTTDVQAMIRQAVSDYINGLGIGDGDIGAIDVGRLYAPTLLLGTLYAKTFTITGLKVARSGTALSTSPVAIAFNEAPYCAPSLVTVTPS